eukprot:gene27090-biopygen17648
MGVQTRSMTKESGMEEDMFSEEPGP